MVWDSSDGNLEFADNAKVTFGTGDDMMIYHDGSHSHILDNGTGDLRVTTNGAKIDFQKSGGEVLARFYTDGQSELYYDNSNKLQTKSDGVNITGELECDTLDVDGDVDFDGGQVTYSASANTLDFADGAKAQFGAGDDLTIVHDGTNSSIENDTGTLTIKNTVSGGFTYIHGDKVHLRSTTSNESFLTSTHNGPVELYYDNVEKLSTEAYGVDITGTLQSDTLIVTGVSTVASLIFSAGTNTNGVSYFDANGQVQSTVSPASGISTSNSILTTNASGVPIWTDTIDCGTF